MYDLKALYEAASVSRTPWSFASNTPRHRS